ncbi:hypothetical protein D9M72_644650 [compost metagenome]
MSGSVTISSSGVPARFRSMPLWPMKSSCSDLPASSSRWARTRRTVFFSSPRKNDTAPPCTTGISNWLIW